MKASNTNNAFYDQIIVNILRIQQRMMDRDPRPDIVVNHVNPGFVDTDMSSHKGTFTIDRWDRIFWLRHSFVRPFVQFKFV